MTDEWTPEVGDWVIYRPHPDAPAEDGQVTVLYRGDWTAKATRVADLTPGPRR